MNKKSINKIYIIFGISAVLGLVAVSISAQNDKPGSIQEIKKITPKISLENNTTDISNYPDSCCNTDTTSTPNNSGSCSNPVSNPKSNDSDSWNRGCCSN